MALARFYAGAGVTDGRLFAVGGCCSGALNSVEAFTP
jgi:hypothetical protein